MLYFVTGNTRKFEEVASMLPLAITQFPINLPEVQDIDAHVVVRAKLEEARAHHDGSFIVEDTSLYFDALNGLPGPLVKWFERAIGNAGLADLARRFENTNAQAKTIIGYANEDGSINFYEGTIAGTIVDPRGDNGFGWDAVFQPEGHVRTLAEMSLSEKNEVSSRRIAVGKLAHALETFQGSTLEKTSL